MMGRLSLGISDFLLRNSELPMSWRCFIEKRIDAVKLVSAEQQ